MMQVKFVYLRFASPHAVWDKGGVAGTGFAVCAMSHPKALTPTHAEPACAAKYGGVLVGRASSGGVVHHRLAQLRLHDPRSQPRHKAPPGGLLQGVSSLIDCS